MQMIKDFMWGAFNYRNKGIPFYLWPKVGFNYMMISKRTRMKRKQMTYAKRKEVE